MSDDLLEYARNEIVKRGIVVSGDAQELGIGAMTNDRWKDFYQMMKDQGLYPDDLNYKEAFSLEFVNDKKWTNFEKNYQ